MKEEKRERKGRKEEQPRHPPLRHFYKEKRAQATGLDSLG
jgi:hypothetical protein